MKAPMSDLPEYSECKLRLENSGYLDSESVNEFPFENTMLSNPIHEFIYEYDCDNDDQSEWFRHGLEKLIQFVKDEAREDALIEAMQRDM